MSKYTNEQYNKIFDKLPQEIRDAVASYDTTQHLWKIGEKRNLHIDKIGIMVDLTFDTMMGIVATKNFAKELQNELQIDALDATTLARDIDENVFKPIKSIMTKLYGDGAPYKPSSSLVQFYEEEDDHQALDKDSLLREIENPAPAVAKVEKSLVLRAESLELETQEEVRELKEMESKAGVTMQSVPVEIKKVEMPVTEAQIPRAEQGISNTLDRIASLKLSKTFVMPRGENVVQMSNSEAEKIPEHKAQPAVPAAPTIEKATPSAKPYTPPASKSYPVDPYREPLV